MTLDCDLSNINTIEFGVGYAPITGHIFSAISVDMDVKLALANMVRNTWQNMRVLGSAPTRYQPAEKHASQEFLFLPLTHRLAAFPKTLFDVANFPLNQLNLTTPNDMFCYFAIFHDTNNKKLIAIKRPAQFKGVVKSKLVHLVSNSLKLVSDTVFKLDSDFDVLVDAANVYILRPSGYELLCDLQSEILRLAPSVVSDIALEITEINFNEIENYVRTHPRAARLAFSISSQENYKDIKISKLKRVCRQMGVTLRTVNNKLEMPDTDILTFLEILDRRLYEIDLTGTQELYRATSRSKYR